MASSFNVQGSVTVRRLRTGTTITLRLVPVGQNALFQGWNGNAAVPDFTVKENQPIVKPVAFAGNKKTVTLSAHKWSWNDAELQFQTDKDTDGYVHDQKGLFALDPTTGALRIIGNIASADNLADDTLTYEGVATVDEVPVKVTASITIRLMPLGASSFALIVTADTTELNTDTASTTLHAQLLDSTGSPVNLADKGFVIKWFKDSEEVTAWQGKTDVEVTRDMVGWQQLFIARVYDSASSSTPIAGYSVVIYDRGDEYGINLLTPDGADITDTVSKVTVKAVLHNFSTDADVELPTGGTWNLQTFGSSDGQPLAKTSNTDTIDITEADMEYTKDGAKRYQDVIVTAEATFDIAD